MKCFGVNSDAEGIVIRVGIAGHHFQSGQAGCSPGQRREGEHIVAGQVGLAGQEQRRNAVVAGIWCRTDNDLLVGHEVRVQAHAIRDEFLALGLGVGETHAARALDGHGALLGRLGSQHAALVGLDELALEVVDAVVPMLHLRCQRCGIIRLLGPCRPNEGDESESG